MKSKQEQAKQDQGYRKEPNHCSNCKHFEFEVEKRAGYYGSYEEKKKLRCGIGGFKVNQNAVCDRWEKK